MDIEILKRMVESIQGMILKVPFERLWPGFHRTPFALYNSEHVVMEDGVFERNDDFVGNTSIKYHGKYIAIWNIMEAIDEEILASKLIHEMFHAFQMEMHESRFPNEFEALTRYVYDPLNLSVRMQEHLLIQQLLSAFEMTKFEELLKHKAFRYVTFPFEYEYESKIEQIEGTAEFVELKALGYINYQKASIKVEKMTQALSHPENLFPIRIINYTSGALFLKILEDHEIGFHQDFDSVPFSVSILTTLEKSNCSAVVDPRMIELIHSDEQSIDQIVQDAIKTSKQILEGPFLLQGVNVYSARYHSGYITSQYFIAYESEGQTIYRYGNFVLKMNGLQIERIYEY